MGIYKRHKQLIPTLILLAFCIQSIVNSIQGKVEISNGYYGFVLTSKHYGAFAFVIINILWYFTFRKSYKYILAITLLLGLLNIINFTPLESTSWFWK